MANCTVYEGHAHFEAPNEIGVGDELLSASRVFINVGGRALVPNMPGLDDISYLTNKSMMDLDVLPHHLVIIGGSYVGLEFAQMYRRFGSEVTVVEKGSRLIQREDEDVSAAVKDILEAEGIHIRLRAECISFARRGADAAVMVECEFWRSRGRWLPYAAGGWTATEYRRSRPREGRCRSRQARIYRGRR